MWNWNNQPQQGNSFMGDGKPNFEDIKTEQKSPNTMQDQFCGHKYHSLVLSQPHLLFLQPSFQLYQPNLSVQYQQPYYYSYDWQGFYKEDQHNKNYGTTLYSLNYQPNQIKSQYKKVIQEEDQIINIDLQISKQQQVKLQEPQSYNNRDANPGDNKSLTKTKHGLSALSNSELTRKQRLERYLIKKKHRTYERKIVYQCRKKVAECRVRVKGRFVKMDHDKGWKKSMFAKVRSLSCK